MVKHVARDRHYRIEAERGKAKDYACVDCSGPALDWSQRHDTDEEDFSCYDPRCRKCHVTYDKHLRHSPEANAKRSAALKGRIFSEETKLQMSETKKLDPLTSERASKAAKARKGIPWTAERRSAYERNKK